MTRATPFELSICDGAVEGGPGGRGERERGTAEVLGVADGDGPGDVGGYFDTLAHGVAVAGLVD